MKHTHILAFTALSAFILSGCSSVQKTFKSITGQSEPAIVATPVTSEPEPSMSEPKKSESNKSTVSEIKASNLSALETESIIDNIVFGRWIIADAGGKAVVASDEGERPYLVFDSTAVNPFILKFYAFTGCNTLNGRLALTPKGHLAKAGEYAATMRLCPDIEAESSIIDALNSVERYKLERIDNNYIMYLYNVAGSNTLVLRRSDMSFLDGAWQVTEISPIKVGNDDMPEPMQLVFDMEEGRLHGNTGCNVLNAKISSSIDKRNSLSISDPITTRMACPNAGLEQQLSNALLKVASAEKGRHSSVNLLDDAGNTVITLRRLNPEI
ncbi:MAG: META domain-containing protein [Pseudoflavonifractor sp.]|nr:META domain-containing protein [Alloprevotella sp.]MCM1116889.1 META domain-containing protein [Pseudoflavonifractor sp.]